MTLSLPMLGGIVLAALVFGAVLFYLFYAGFISPQQAQKAQQTTRREVDRARSAERDRLRSIYAVISVLTTTLKYERVLELVLDLGATTLSSSQSQTVRLVSAVMLFVQEQGADRPTLNIRLARGLAAPDRRQVLPARRGALAAAIESGEPTVCDNPLEDPELSRLIGLHPTKSVFILPLRTGLDTYGALLFAHPDPGYFSTANREALDILVRQAMVAIQNARLYSDLETEKERMMEIQEEARKKLARDLHDGPTQSVAAIAMRVNFVRRLLDRDLKAAGEEMVKIEELARRTTKEIRHMLFTLRPLILESQGLRAALEAMAEKMRETYDQNVLVDVNEAVLQELEMGKQTIVFYIAEEAVNNARKHAQAAHIWVRLKSMGHEMVVLEIQDDGVGFNIGAVDANYERRGSLGMINMRERSELVNGLLRIDSAEGKGTRIQVIIPCSEDAADRLRQGR